MSNTKLRFCFIVTGIFSVLLANAQRDSTQSISITTEYQPVLRNAAKLNFSGTHHPLQAALRYLLLCGQG